MNYTCSAPARQAAPELPEHNLPVAPGVKKTAQGSGNLVAYLRLLWEQRRVFARVPSAGSARARFWHFSSLCGALAKPMSSNSTAWSRN
jgi:hypothetical protein